MSYRDFDRALVRFGRIDVLASMADLGWLGAEYHFGLEREGHPRRAWAPGIALALADVASDGRERDVSVAGNAVMVSVDTLLV
jgi:hypothetical protein